MYIKLYWIIRKLDTEKSLLLDDYLRSVAALVLALIIHYRKGFTTTKKYIMIFYFIYQSKQLFKGKFLLSYIGITPWS